MDNPTNRKLPPLDQSQRADSQPKSGTRPQIISSNKFQPSAAPKKTGPASMEEIDNIICYFCGGADCKKEQASSNKNKNAIDGLHSDWITDNILAMQRLSTKLMDTVVPQFKINNIGAVINLQQQGEHAQCGPPLIPSVGFTYNPEVLQSAKISFFNYGWEDMTADTDVANLLRICSAFEMCLKKGQKVAVHCHAGTGRTGVAIVSWLIYGEGMTADEGIRLFQARRRDSLGKTSQKDLLRNFEKYLSNRKWFEYPKIPGLRNDEIINQQNKFAIGETKNQLKYLPAPFQVVLKRFATLLESKILTSKQIIDAIVGDPLKLSPIDNQELIKLEQQFNRHCYHVGQIGDLRILAQLMFEYFNQLPWQCLADKIVFVIKPHFNDKTITEILKLVIKDLEIYTFSILKGIVQFAILLKNSDPSINLKGLFYRFGISLLQKQSYLDENFVGHALVRLDKIEIVQIVFLAQFLQKWVEESKSEQLFEENQLSKEMRTLLK